MFCNLLETDLKTISVFSSLRKEETNCKGLLKER